MVLILAWQPLAADPQFQLFRAFLREELLDLLVFLRCVEVNQITAPGLRVEKCLFPCAVRFYHLIAVRFFFFLRGGCGFL